MKSKYIYSIHSKKNNLKSFRLTKQGKDTVIFIKGNHNNNNNIIRIELNYRYLKLFISMKNSKAYKK